MTMLTRGVLLLAAGLGLCSPAAAQSDHPARVVRVIGEASAPEGSAIPKRFVLDAAIRPGDSEFQGSIDGWFAALPPETASHEFDGQCVDSKCAISVELEDGKLAITGELVSGAQGRFVFTRDEEGSAPVQGTVKFTAVTGPIEGVGEIAAPGAVSAAELDELLAWNGTGTGFSNVTKELPDDTERDALATWQGQQGRPMTGLILVEDLKALREATAAAKAKVGWTQIGDPAQGWSAGYPATLLPKASGSGGQHIYESADGKTRLVVALEPAKSHDDFEAFVDQQTADRPGVSDRSYTRVNDDMEISWTEGGVVTSAAYHNREGGFARVVFSYPADQADAWSLYADLLPRALKLTDALKGQ